MRHTIRTLTLGSVTLLALAASAPAASAVARQERPAADARADQDAAREAAREYYRRENTHVRRRARIERLLDIYGRNGNEDRVRILEALRERDEVAHRAQLARLQQRIGDARFEALQSTRRAEIAQRLRLVQQNRERANAAVRDDPRHPDARPDARVVDRPAPRPAPRSDRPRPRR